MSGRSHSTPALALMKAFAPGPSGALRECRSVDWAAATFVGEKVAVEYALPDAAARSRAFALVEVAKGAAAADIPMRGWMFIEVAAEVRGDTLHVEGVAVRD